MFSYNKFYELIKKVHRLGTSFSDLKNKVHAEIGNLKT
jgi:hypothetical protein